MQCIPMPLLGVFCHYGSAIFLGTAQHESAVNTRRLFGKIRCFRTCLREHYMLVTFTASTRAYAGRQGSWAFWTKSSKPEMSKPNLPFVLIMGSLAPLALQSANRQIQFRRLRSTPWSPPGREDALHQPEWKAKRDPSTHHSTQFLRENMEQAWKLHACIRAWVATHGSSMHQCTDVSSLQRRRQQRRQRRQQQRRQQHQ